MGFSPNPMSPTLLLLLLCTTIFFIPANTHYQPNDQSFLSVTISQKGLTFAKDLLIKEAILSLTPLQLPEIKKSIDIPFIGDVEIVLSNITLYEVDVYSSLVKTGETGVAFIVSGATANLSMDWRYSYQSWLVEFTDHGHASVQVEGLGVGLTIGLENQQGTLNLVLMECGCYVKDISIDLDGGASWLYQGLIDTFEGQIRSSVEYAITDKLEEGISKLDSSLQTLPKEIPVDDIAALNNTFVNAPTLTNSSIGLDINGLFTAANKSEVPNSFHKILQPSVTCKGPQKMLAISLDEAIFNSGSAVYFNAGVLEWFVDKVPEQSLLKTRSWKHIIPELYKKYPEKDMGLNVSLSSPPIIRVSSPSNIDATIYSDITINVLDDNEILPVACISLVISATGSVKVRGNSLAGTLKLDDFKLSLKWSNIGHFHMSLIQSLMWTFLKTVAFPFANVWLIQGFPLPILDGFTLQNADILCANSRIVICSDVLFTH